MAQANNTVPDSISNESHLPISTNTHVDSFTQDSDKQESIPPANSSKLTLRLHNVTRPMDQSSKFRSEAWNYFHVVDGRAICKLCNKSYTYSQGSTSNLLRHVKSHQSGAVSHNSNVVKDIRPKLKTPAEPTVETAQHLQQVEHSSEPRSLPQPQQLPPVQPPKDSVPEYTPPVSKQMPIPQNSANNIASYRPSYTPPGTTDAPTASGSEPSAKRPKVETHFHDLTPPTLPPHTTHQHVPPPPPPKPPALQRQLKQAVQSTNIPETVPAENYDEESFRNDLVNLFLNNNLSFDLIESPDFITIFRKLTPHKLCSSTMMKLLVLTKLQLQGKELFENLGKKH